MHETTNAQRLLLSIAPIVDSGVHIGTPMEPVLKLARAALTPGMSGEEMMAMTKEIDPAALAVGVVSLESWNEFFRGLHAILNASMVIVTREHATTLAGFHSYLDSITKLADTFDEQSTRVR